jgi:predicted nucleic acid-binding protein
MAVILDTGILYAYYDARDLWHSHALQIIRDTSHELIIPSPVVAEVDYLLNSRRGFTAQVKFYQGMAEGYYQVSDLSATGHRRVFELNQQYADLRLGFVDAGVITIAEELGIGRIATTDRRHFAVVKAKIPLVLLPELLTTP